MRNSIVLILILALAAFFRFYQLDQIPPGLYPDEAINANQAITEPGKVFYTDNNGREGLFINLLWVSFSLFGISVWSFKIVPAFFGTLTVLGTYLLTKELFNKETMEQWKNEAIALLSSFFVATSFWHINFSRIGFRAILLPFILVFSFYFLWRGFRTKNWLQIIIGSFIFGLGFYTYTSFRVAVLLLIVFLFLWLLIYRKEERIKQFILFASACLITIFISGLPIGLYFIQHPKDFAQRAAPISIFAQENPLKAFAESFIEHLAMFNIYGDPNWRHNFATSPQLLWPVGLLFLIGIALALRTILRDCLRYLHYLSRKPPQKHSNILQNVRMFLGQPELGGLSYIFLLSWLFIMLLPGALTYEGLPHALRTIGVIPVPYIFAAVGGTTIWQWLSSKNIPKKILVSLAVIFIAGLGLAEYHKYFIAWGKSDEVKDAFTDYYVRIGDYLNSLPDAVKKYVIINEYGMPLYGISIPAQTPMFIERTKYGSLRAEYIKAEQLSEIELTSAKTVILPLYPESVSESLQKTFPQATSEKINGIRVFKIKNK